MKVLVMTPKSRSDEKITFRGEFMRVTNQMHSTSVDRGISIIYTGTMYIVDAVGGRLVLCVCVCKGKEVKRSVMIDCV